MLKTGELVDGKYKILNKIGQGGNGIVYLAIHEQLGKKRAVKEIRIESLGKNELARQRILSEIEILKNLEHPCLPEIIDVKVSGDSVLIIMEYIEGMNLKDRLSRHGPMGEEEVINIAFQLTEVLAYLHSRKPPVIYRDLKPSNIIIRKDGRISIIDFGAARQFHVGGEEDTVCLGTRGYAAPEQYGGKGQTDERSDIYCLGVTLYHLVTGKSPEEPPYYICPIREWNPDLSEGLEAVIGKCTIANPEERYQSCEELIYALRHLQEWEVGYRKKEKIKTGLFLVLSLGVILCFSGSIYLDKAQRICRQQLACSYLNYAERAVGDEEAASNYKKALMLYPEWKKIYVSLQNRFIRPGEFDMEDAAVLIGIFQPEEGKVPVLETYKTKDKKGFCDFCYQIGIGYFYYLGGVEGKKGAGPWFHEVIKADSSSFPASKEKRAKIYFNISEYYRNFVGKEKDQSGEMKMDNYGDFYQALHGLNQFYADKNSPASDAAAAFLISKEIAVEIRTYARELLQDKKVEYIMLKKELDIIGGKTKRGRKRMECMELHRTREEMDELREIIKEAEKQLLLAYQTK